MKKKKQNTTPYIYDLEFPGLRIWEGVFPLLTEADSPSDCDESGLGRWHGSQARHLGRVRAVRLHTQTRRVPFP